MSRRSATTVALATREDAESLVRLRNAFADDVTVLYGPFLAPWVQDNAEAADQ
jgi:hypothetical protein